MPRNVHSSYPPIKFTVPKTSPENVVEKLKYLESRIYFQHEAVTKNQELPKNDKNRWSDDLIPEYTDLYERISWYDGKPHRLENIPRDVVEFPNPSPKCKNAYELLKKNNCLFKYPKNPVECTGYTGRGLFGKWGPNYAADPVVVTNIPNTLFGLKFVGIKRKDCGLWAIPGGMVECGETVSQTLRKEFMEETQNLPNIDKVYIESVLDSVFKKGELVYRGYINDPRNTDNAWMETSVFKFFIDNKVANKLLLHAGDDACNVDWINISNNDPRYVNLYADHKKYIDKIYYKNIINIIWDFIKFYSKLYGIIVVILTISNSIAYLRSKTH